MASTVVEIIISFATHPGKPHDLPDPPSTPCSLLDATGLPQGPSDLAARVRNTVTIRVVSSPYNLTKSHDPPSSSSSQSTQIVRPPRDRSSLARRLTRPQSTLLGHVNSYHKKGSNNSIVTTRIIPMIIVIYICICYIFAYIYTYTYIRRSIIELLVILKF